MIRQSSSSSSCSTRNAEATTVPSLTLYGSPAPRSVHRTSLGAVRARPHQKLIKPTTPALSTPDLYLNLSSPAESDSEYDNSLRKFNLVMSDIPVQQDISHFRSKHSNLPSPGAPSCLLSHRPNTNPPHKKSCGKINHKLKVSQVLFHYDEFQRTNKHNSHTEASYSPHKQKFTARKNFSPKSQKMSSRTVPLDQISVHNSIEEICSEFKECIESDLSVSTFQSTIERSNRVCTLSGKKAENCFDFSKQRHNFQKELSYQASAAFPLSRLQQINLDKTLICGINMEIKDIDSVKSYHEVTKQSTYLKNAETSTGSTISGCASKEERNFQLLNEENKLLEDDCENLAISNCEITVNEIYSKDQTVSPNNYELPTLNTQSDLCSYDMSTNNINNEKASTQLFIPSDDRKRKNFGRCIHSKCNINNGSTSPVDLESNHSKITENEENHFLARENSTNCTFVSMSDYNRVSDELREEGETSPSSQGSLTRERKTSDVSWSSSSALSDSTWGYSSDTYESLHSEDICHRKYSFSTSDDLNSNTPRRNPQNSLSAEMYINAISETISQKQTNKDFEQTRLSNGNEWGPDHFEIGMRENIQPQNKSTNKLDSSKHSISDEICQMKNGSCKDGANETRLSSSSGITGSIAMDSSNDVHYRSSECFLQEFMSKEKENVTRAFSTYSEEGAVTEEEEEMISTATSEELCLLCSYNLKGCRCLPFPKTTSHNSISENSNNEHTQNLTDSTSSLPSFVRNFCSAPGYHSEYERLLQRFGCCTTAPDVVLSVDEIIEAAMHARQLVHVLEKALDRALSLKMTCVSETVSQSNLRQSESLPELISKRSITNKKHIPISVEDSSLNTAHTLKYNKWRNCHTNFNKRQENAGAGEGFTASQQFSLSDQKKTDQKNAIAERIKVCQEKCYCSGPKLLNISPQELQQQKALLRPVDKKPQAFMVMKDMASILKSVISHRRDIIVPPEDAAYYVSRSVSEWSIDE